MFRLNGTSNYPRIRQDNDNLHIDTYASSSALQISNGGNLNTTGNITVGTGQIHTPSGTDLQLVPNTGVASVAGNLRITGKMTQGSDINLKTNISTIETPLDKISKIRGVQFDWKSDNEPGGGVIAQELEEVCPEFVHDIGNGTGHKSVDYNGVIAVMIESIKELKNEVETLKAKCNCKGDK